MGSLYNNLMTYVHFASVLMLKKKHGQSVQQSNDLRTFCFCPHAKKPWGSLYNNLMTYVHFASVLMLKKTWAVCTTIYRSRRHYSFSVDSVGAETALTLPRREVKLSPLELQIRALAIRPRARVRQLSTAQRQSTSRDKLITCVCRRDRR